MAYPDVLAERYAGDILRGIWSPRSRFALERSFWIRVLLLQRGMGVDVPDSAVEAYRRYQADVDQEDIRRRERVTKHDVKARLESYNAQAGYECLHLGMTSRDLTDNVEQIQQLRTMCYLGDRTYQLLGMLAGLCEEHRESRLVARTHNVVAIPTTLGFRLAMFGQPLYRAWRRLVDFRLTYPMRGIKGAVGNYADMSVLLGSVEKARQLEQGVACHFGFSSVLPVTGQIYPRQLDGEVVEIYGALVAALNSLASTLRLMAGIGFFREELAEGQVGSSAMPHKVNAVGCERVQGFHTLLKGYLTMAQHLAGAQWNEGDVSCSVVRRVLLPQSAFAVDGALTAMREVLLGAWWGTGSMAVEIHRDDSGLASSRLLTMAAARGGPREDMHRMIKETGGYFMELGENPGFPLSVEEIEVVLEGVSECQETTFGSVDAFVADVRSHADDLGR